VTKDINGVMDAQAVETTASQLFNNKLTDEMLDTIIDLTEGLK
jgi:hypothetical protein